MDDIDARRQSSCQQVSSLYSLASYCDNTQNGSVRFSIVFCVLVLDISSVLVYFFFNNNLNCENFLLLWTTFMQNLKQC